MSSEESKTILISEPGAADMPQPFLPYMWATLKSYCERDAEIAAGCSWLDPIYRNASARSLLEPYQAARIDVLGLSCYTWNWRLQCQIAEQVKARNPRCLVVAGGPHPDYKDTAFFRKHPYVDMIAAKDGEITFSKILKKVLAGENSFTDVRGLYLPQPDGQAHIFTGPAEVPTTFDHSPYAEQSAYYEKLRAGSGDFSATWETNRGCPYSCSFCDWGSSTMSKVRQFDMERVKAEIDWFGRMKVWVLFLADANFGILQRDLEIADLICATRQKYGYPKYLAYSNPKNNPERAVAIARKLIASGLMMQYDLSLQHTNEEVLAATDRSNISPEKQIEVVRQLMQDGVPIEVQLIIGIPGDTYERWKLCLADLMERGIHGSYMTFPYQLLPNAPAAEPAFLKKWEVETIERYTLTNSDREHGISDRATAATATFIVKTNTYSRADWVRSNTYTCFVKALHSCSLTQLVATYLRFTHGVPYSAFYDAVIEEFCPVAPPAAECHRRLVAHYEAFLRDEDATNYMKSEQLPAYQAPLDPARWLLVQICLESERFFDALAAFLAQRFPLAANLRSAVEFQRNLVILPDYDNQAGKSFPTDLDWIAYFDKATRLNTYQPLAEPEPAPGGVVEVTDKTCTNHVHHYSLDWSRTSLQQRWPKWIDATVVGRNSRHRNNFQSLRFRAAGATRSAAAPGAFSARGQGHAD